MPGETNLTWINQCHEVTLRRRAIWTEHRQIDHGLHLKNIDICHSKWLQVRFIEVMIGFEVDKHFLIIL